jgi:dihydrofolate reductase
VASTLDGCIAHPDGSFDGFPADEAYLAELLGAFPETFPVTLRPARARRADNRRFDAVLMGRRTYEVGLEAGIASPYPTLDQYVRKRKHLEDTFVHPRGHVRLHDRIEN